MKPVLGTPASIASSADFSCISELLESVVIFFLCPISLSIYTSWEIYTIPGCYKDVYINSFFACAEKLWNSFSEECFPLIYDLNGFKSRVNKHLLFVCSFWSAFQYDFHLCLFFSCNSMPCWSYSALHEKKLNRKGEAQQNYHPINQITSFQCIFLLIQVNTCLLKSMFL